FISGDRLSFGRSFRAPRSRDSEESRVSAIERRASRRFTGSCFARRPIMTPAGNLAWPGHSVIREILRRRDHHVLGNSQEAKASAVKLALVVEGGGMRGIYSGGVMVSMEELGLSGVFDNVYGESAGGPNCCYFLSGQGKLGIRIYLEDLPSRKFVNP